MFAFMQVCLSGPSCTHARIHAHFNKSLQMLAQLEHGNHV